MREFLQRQIATWLVLLALGGETVAAVPRIVAFSGKLADTRGRPVDGTVNLTFRIYDAPTGGVSLWTETQNTIVDKGSFSIILGSVTALTPAFDTGYWLSIEVENMGEMVPRQELTSAPYALRSAVSDTSVFATNAAVAMRAISADAATRADSAASSDRALLADKATAADTAVLADKATTADRAVLADTATTATRADSAVIADRATVAETASTADSATLADRAMVADRAATAERATVADTAGNADSATLADRATRADTATTASRADTASHADRATIADDVSEAVLARLVLRKGVIVMWSGALADIPTGWALCDGSVVAGVQTPNLKDRFIAAAGGTYTVGSTGGATAQEFSLSGPVRLSGPTVRVDDHSGGDDHDLPDTRQQLTLTVNSRRVRVISNISVSFFGDKR